MTPRIIKFALVGGVGFVADALVFSLMFYLLGLPIMPARIIAFICAATVTWLGNRYFTFCQSDKCKPLGQWVKFMCGASFSAVPNLVAFQLIVWSFGPSKVVVYSALVIGILVGMLSNYFLSSRWVFSTPN